MAKAKPAKSTVRPLRGTDTAAVRAAAASAGHRFVEIDLQGCADRESALREFGRRLELPSWFGANLDALYDALTDLDGPGWMLVVRLPQAGPSFSRQDRAALLAALRDAADYHRGGGATSFSVRYC